MRRWSTVPEPVAEYAGEGNSGELNAAPATPAPSTPKRPETVAGEKARFVTRSAGLGEGWCQIRSTDTFNGGGSFPWKWLYNTIGNSRWQWPARYGVTLYGLNYSYWTFDPRRGAGAGHEFSDSHHPIVAMIGPVNYYLLRAGELNLTVPTVPTGALFLTAAPSLYALFSDGSSVRLRARSMTCIDQTIGEATCWSRLSYHAGLCRREDGFPAIRRWRHWKFSPWPASRAVHAARSIGCELIGPSQPRR